MSSTKCAVACKIMTPLCNAASKVQARSAKKLAALTDAGIQKTISEHNANGTDAAVSSTKRYLAEQRQLFHYRVVRFFDECHYIISGEYFAQYTKVNLIWDLRFLTKLVVLFLIGTVLGRQSIFPPIDPDSPLVEALVTKVNPNY
ncbi:hypothetical protein, conserved [Trypanosoma brucei gambiense DAL972]|uniref:Uncharacterized protein n=2 Tax=Trypanosoma brucei TaxID=5691 RepID=C9ZJA0_TRYB9|nr:hypothetical protein, conserved [Trypanosoma brucei gambiense DAL972]8AP6_M Chain M, subunit-g [Trypanosoma brucei brucei]8AP6_m Chain m, subunit-g [Trypanosoma brucei brucei]8AP7_M Chain M, subunit-g [Trypanosoma brucei brucei]8AP7_m Chain m, subunit-g [Trypanosoma brucei brucei]8APA_M Chain M, subunit-g [Trypanosoma brucei brucei]8APA_m Chain m, subunit-g [Trypanosoma brucei brucei]8APB_M Chain M, subunit-g [Trypanosoma brucei brucei]8APB_m Chain m, subunit-g [Trypanosoma brucei brucei|eukprot:XP_011771764.1 hypothetical protein, conserved [Trypanosoma brucei gambiense DAL972]